MVFRCLGTWFDRYSGTDAALMTAVTSHGSAALEFSDATAVAEALQGAKDAFLHRYRTEFGFDLPDR